MFFDVVIIVCLFSLFAGIHTFLALEKVKTKIAENSGSKVALYRLFYNFISLITFAAFWELSPRPDYYIYDLDTPFDLIVVGFQILSLVGLAWAFKSSMSSSEFLGVKQLVSYLKGNYNLSDKDEKLKFSTRGPYKFVRHPIYFFSILFIGLRPAMSVFYFVFFICSVVYFSIGAEFEEKRMISSFGDEYIEYKKKVPGIIPIRFNRK